MKLYTFKTNPKWDEYKKYSLVGNKDNHWEYCCINSIPHIIIYKSSGKYTSIDYDAWSITKNERFTMLDFTDHVKPLYQLYSDYNKLPQSKYRLVGGGRNGKITVHSEDVIQIAEKLFDFIMLLAVQDQELFEMNPIYINAEGKNSEGVNVENLKSYLKQMETEELRNYYLGMKKNESFKYTPKRHQIFIDELNTRMQK